MKHVQLKWRRGEEAICPECHRYNACLHTGNIGQTTIYECRDCHTIFATDNAACPGSEDHEKNMVQDAIIVTRTLGKTCSGCRSFNIQDVTYEERQLINKEAKNPWDRKEHICRDCGKLWG